MFSKLFPNYTRVILPVLALICGVASLAVSAGGDEIKTEMNAAVAAVRPALIRILVVSAEYNQGREIKVESAGSGVIISPDGYAITNHHVAGNAQRLVCTLADRRVVDAKLVGTDPLGDIAVIKLVSPDNKPFPAASFGDSSKLEVGDRVYAMGCPYALSQSVTNGIVSNTELVMPPNMSDEEFTLEGEDVGSIVRWIGHDALIKPGNSGGPLVDGEGKIIGINEISVGLSGAIPSNLAKEIADQLIRSGKVTRAWIGLEIQPLLRSSNLEKGILISGVLPDSPALKANFKAGDVLISLGDREVVARFKEQVPLFNQYVADLPIGKPVSAVVTRDGKQITLTLTPTERQKATAKEHEFKSWGICASDLTYLDKQEMQRDSDSGVMVTSVLPSGPSGTAKPPLTDGDIITRIGNDNIKDTAVLRTVTKQLTSNKTDQSPVLVYFDRGTKHLVTVIEVGKNEDTNSGIEISKAWLPIDMQVLTRQLAEGLGVPGKTGVRVTEVYPNSSAAKAGLKVGDLIVKLDGEKIPADQVEDEEVLPSMIRQYDVGAEAKLGIIRDGKPMDIKVKLEASPKPPRDYPTYDDENFEFTARDISFADRANGSVTSKQIGVYVETVSEGSWAALADLQADDVITAIDGNPISNLQALKTAMTSIAQRKPKTVVFKVQRGIHTSFIEIEPSWPDNAQ